MKNHYAITISDTAGSRHYFVKDTLKRTLVLTGVAVLIVLTASLVANGFQYGLVSSLSSQTQKLHNELDTLHSTNLNLERIIASHLEQSKNISKALVEIERSSGVDTDGLDITLEQRMKRIGKFYNAKEQEYSVIGIRVEHLEGIIGIENEALNRDEPDLTTRIELASLTASQERILHDNIPNGYPTASEQITSRFGMRTHPVTKTGSFHKGVDIRAKPGEPVFATASGIVSDSDYSDLNGNRVVLLHNFGFQTRYAHLKESLVSPGDIIRKGELLGYSGNTGRSIAPHLHYEIRYLGKSIDPLQFLHWESGAHDLFTQVRGIKWPSLMDLINQQVAHQALQLSHLHRIAPGE